MNQAPSPLSSARAQNLRVLDLLLLWLAGWCSSSKMFINAFSRVSPTAFSTAATFFRRLVGKPNSAGCLDNDFSAAADLKRSSGCVLQESDDSTEK